MEIWEKCLHLLCCTLVLYIWKFVNASDTEATGKIPVALNILNKKSNHEYDYIRKNRLAVFTAKETHGFKLIRNQNCVIWQTKKGEPYAKRVVIDDEGTYRISIIFPDGSVKHLNRLTRSSKEIIPELVDVDIMRNGSNFVYYYFDRGINTYCAYDEYIINKVRSGFQKIWETDIPSEYATKVFIRSGPDSKKILKVISCNGESKKFVKTGTFSVWTDMSDDTEEVAESPESSELTQAKKSKSEPTLLFYDMSEPILNPRKPRIIHTTETEDEMTPVVDSNYELIPLDITTNDSTDEFEYENGKYTCKYGYRFDLVKKGGHLLKQLEEPSNKVHVYYTQPGKILLSIYTSYKLFDLVVVDDPGPTVIKAPLTDPGVSPVEIVSESLAYAEHLELLEVNDDGEKEEIDRSRYKVQDLTTLLSYTFKEGTRCTEVKYNNDTVWKHNVSVHGHNYPTNMLLNTVGDFVVIESATKYQFFFSYYSNRWNQIHGFNDSKPLSPYKLEFFLLDGSSFKPEDENSLTERYVAGPMTTYRFRYGQKCVRVIYEENTLWEFSKTEHLYRYPTTITVNTDQNSLTVDSEGDYRYIYKYYENKFTCIIGYKPRLSEPLDLEKLSILTMNEEGIVADDSSKYDKSITYTSVTYNMKTNAKCTEVKYDGESVWTYFYAEYGNEFPNYIVINLDKNYLTVESSYNYKSVYAYYDKKWTQVPFGYKSSRVNSNKIRLLALDSFNNYMELQPTRYDIEETGLLYTIKFKEDTRCREVRYDNQSVWRYSYREHRDIYPTSIVLNKSRSHLIVESNYDYRYFYGYYNKRWKQLPFGFTLNSGYITSRLLEPKKLKLYSLDSDNNKVEIGSSSYQFEESDSASTVVFEDEVNCSEIHYKNQLVWKYDEAEHGNFYPTTLILNNANSYITVESSHDYRYIYGYHDREWRPLPSGFRLKIKSESSMYQKGGEFFDLSKLKLYTLSSVDKVVEMSESQCDKERYGSITQYKFKESNPCVEIRYNNRLIWEHEAHKHGKSFPTNVFVNTSTSFLLVQSDENYQYYFSHYNNKWKCIHCYNPPKDTSKAESAVVGPLEPEKLMFYHEKYSESNVELQPISYTVESNDGVFSYTFKKGIKCSLIKYGDQIAWRFKPFRHDYKYPTEVLLDTATNTLYVECANNYLDKYMFNTGILDTKAYEESEEDKSGQLPDDTI